MTLNPQQPTPEQLAMARRIVAGLQTDPTYQNHTLLGYRDATLSVRIALAAIIETTESAAKLTEQTMIDARTGEIDNDLRSISYILQSRLRNNEHLKDQP